MASRSSSKRRRSSIPVFSAASSSAGRPHWTPVPVAPGVGVAVIGAAPVVEVVITGFAEVDIVSTTVVAPPVLIGMVIEAVGAGFVVVGQAIGIVMSAPTIGGAVIAAVAAAAVCLWAAMLAVKICVNAGMRARISKNAVYANG